MICSENSQPIKSLISVVASLPLSRRRRFKLIILKINGINFIKQSGMQQHLFVKKITATYNLHPVPDRGSTPRTSSLINVTSSDKKGLEVLALKWIFEEQ